MVQNQNSGGVNAIQIMPRVYFAETRAGLEARLTEDDKNYYYKSFATSKKSYANEIQRQTSNLEPSDYLRVASSTTGADGLHFVVDNGFVYGVYIRGKITKHSSHPAVIEKGDETRSTNIRSQETYINVRAIVNHGEVTPELLAYLQQLNPHDTNRGAISRVRELVKRPS